MGVIIGGLGALIGLAVVIGHLLDREGRDAAWRRIATSRRLNTATARDLEETVLALHVWEETLERRERWLDLREERLSLRENLLEQMERRWPPDAEPTESGTAT